MTVCILGLSGGETQLTRLHDCLYTGSGRWRDSACQADHDCLYTGSGWWRDPAGQADKLIMTVCILSLAVGELQMARLIMNVCIMGLAVEEHQLARLIMTVFIQGLAAGSPSWSV